LDRKKSVPLIRNGSHLEQLAGKMTEDQLIPVYLETAVEKEVVWCGSGGS